MLFRLLCVLAFWLSLATPLFAASKDVGEIATVEDSTGKIFASPGVSMPDQFCYNTACAFYKNHGDDYDVLFVFNNAATNMQQGWSVVNDFDGIGRTKFNWRKNACAKNRLRIIVNMGNIVNSGVPFDPDQNAPIVLMYPLTGIELMGHEFGHHWMASVNYDRGSGMECLLRAWEGSSSGGKKDGDMCSGATTMGYNQHWSHYFNSCSLMYGSCIEDKGGGKFQFTYNEPKYSQLDQYLMGLRSAEEVDPMFVVDTGDNSVGSAAIPMSHGSSAEVAGTRVDVTIQDIIRANGERKPFPTFCHWKAAFILAYKPNKPPTAKQIQQVDNYRVRWESFFDWATDHRASVDTTLKSCGTGTETCPGEKSSRCEATNLCEENQTRCNGVLVQICQGGEWKFKEECGLGYVCVGGACEPEETDGDDIVTDGDEAVTDGDEDPADGDTSPDGDPSVEDGDAQTTDGDRGCTSAEDCPALHRCSPSTHTCIACPVGTVRVVNNICTQSPAETDGDDGSSEQATKDSGCNQTSGAGLWLTFVALALLASRRVKLRE